MTACPYAARAFAVWLIDLRIEHLADGGEHYCLDAPQRIPAGGAVRHSPLGYLTGHGYTPRPDHPETH